MTDRDQEAAVTAAAGGDPAAARSPLRGPRNIVVYSDGTGQDGGVRADQRLSNVYKMFRASRVGPDTRIDPSLQVAFYDPGLGTEADAHGFGRTWRTVGKLLASIAGRGIGTNIVDCYEFILNHWRPGDRIYIVGFSRGAYTARCVAQVLSLCGVPTHEAGEPSKPFRRFRASTRAAAKRAVHQVYEHGAGHPIAEFEAERDEQGRRFRADFGSDVDGIPNASPYFIGVFDTVAALGAKGIKYYAILAAFWTAGVLALALASFLLHLLIGIAFLPTLLVASLVASAAALLVERRSSRRWIDDFPAVGDPRRSHRVRWHADDYDRGLSGRVGFARQASAIDEDRADFPRVPWGRNTVVRKAVEGEPPPLVQLWFAGNHSDVGGSYEEAEWRLSDVALQWIVDEASSLPHPLLFDPSRLNLWPDHAGAQHSELTAMADRLGGLRWLPARLRRGWAPGARKPILSPMHPSVHARFAEPTVQQPGGEGPYRPPALVEDDRFRHFWQGGEPLSAGAKEFALASTYEVHDAERGWIGPTLASEPGGAAPALLFAGDWIDAEPDAYAESLAMRELQRIINARGIVRYRARRTAASGRVVEGLALRVEDSLASSLARSIGQPLWIRFSAEGPDARHSF